MANEGKFMQILCWVKHSVDKNVTVECRETFFNLTNLSHCSVLELS